MVDTSAQRPALGAVIEFGQLAGEVFSVAEMSPAPSCGRLAVLIRGEAPWSELASAPRRASIRRFRKPQRLDGVAVLRRRRAAIVVPADAARARRSDVEGDALERELVLVEVGDADRVAAAPRAAVAAGR
jgi:hypothetical protein